MPNTDLGYLGFRLLARHAVFVVFWDFPKSRMWGLAEMGRVHTTPDATTRSGVAPGMVSEDLKKKVDVRRNFIDQN